MGEKAEPRSLASFSIMCQILPFSIFTVPKRKQRRNLTNRKGEKNRWLRSTSPSCVWHREKLVLCSKYLLCHKFTDRAQTQKSRGRTVIGWKDLKSVIKRSALGTMMVKAFKMRICNLKERKNGKLAAQLQFPQLCRASSIKTGKANTRSIPSSSVLWHISAVVLWLRRELSSKEPEIQLHTFSLYA